MGAWIETYNTMAKEKSTIVAPYVGAWIETEKEVKAYKKYMSHPTWVRGLKQKRLRINITRQCRTLRGCVD